METRFRYHTDRRVHRITWALLAILLLVTAYATYRFFNIGIYYPVWFLSLALAVVALYILSIPRSVRLTDEALEIHCIVELTAIKYEDLQSVKMIKNDRPGLFILLGSYGFFGYYGYYLDYRNWEIVKLYASRWSGMVEVTDIYEQRYIITPENPEALVALLHEKMEAR